MGDDGVITVDDGPLIGLNVNFVEDFEFDNGYVSPYLVTDPGSMLAVLDDPYILFSAEKISDVRTLMPMLERIMRDPAPLVIIAEKVEGSALQMLVHNHVNGHLKTTAIQAPGFGEKRVHLLEDMAALCGGQVFSRASAFSLEQMGVEHLGRARQVRATSDHTAIIGGGGDPAAREVAAVPAARRDGPHDDRHRRGLVLGAHRPPLGQGRDPAGRVPRRTRSSRRSATASTTRCRPRGPRWPRASSPAAAPRSCTPRRRWTTSRA